MSIVFNPTDLIPTPTPPSSRVPKRTVCVGVAAAALMIGLTGCQSTTDRARASLEQQRASFDGELEVRVPDYPDNAAFESAVMTDFVLVGQILVTDPESPPTDLMLDSPTTYIYDSTETEGSNDAVTLSVYFSGAADDTDPSTTGIYTCRNYTIDVPDQRVTSTSTPCPDGLGSPSRQQIDLD